MKKLPLRYRQMLYFQPNIDRTGYDVNTQEEIAFAKKNIAILKSMRETLSTIKPTGILQETPDQKRRIQDDSHPSIRIEKFKKRLADLENDFNVNSVEAHQEAY